LAIGLVYSISGVVWIFVSDRLVQSWAANPSQQLYWQTVKGLAFVAISGLLIAGFVYLVLARRDAAQERQREAGRALSALLSHVPVMACRRLVDADFTMKLVSEGALELTGYRPEDLLDNRKTPYAAIVHPEDRENVRKEIQRAVSKGGPYEASYRIVAAEGATKWVQERGRALRDGAENGEVLEGIVTDITQQKATDARMSQAARLEALGTLAAGTAHDFNNALAGIMGFVELILEDVPPDSQLERDLFQISRIANNVQHLTGQLLAFSRREPAQFVVVDLNSVVADASRVLDRVAGDRIEVVFNHGKESSFVEVDRSLLEHVLLNLIVNARDAMPEGGRITVSSEVVSLPEEEDSEGGEPRFRKFARLSVSDTGCGIEPSIKEKIFEPFFSTKGGKGTGLGLSTVYGTVTQANGRIEVDSMPGAGATFKVLFPLTHRSPEEERVVRRLDLKSKPLTVLALEDDAAVLEFIQRVLEAEGVQVIPARAAEEALKIGERKLIDLLITDSVLPKLLGVDVYAQLKAKRPDLKVLYVSGSFDSALLRKRGDESAGPKLRKPFTPIELLEAVAVAMG
jgi:two-component system, cell cycle sensor histidine kinase and response regulator CckA